MMKKGPLAAIGAILLTVSGAAQPSAFEQQLKEYVRLRTELAGRLAPLAPTANPWELARRQEDLAHALQTARKNARRGDVIPPLVADQMAAVVREDFAQRGAAEQAALRALPGPARPFVNQRCPEDAELTPVPPLLLKKFPSLPDNLQYRFASQHLLLIDGDAQIIVDYVPNVLPAR